MEGECDLHSMGGLVLGMVILMDILENGLRILRVRMEKMELGRECRRKEVV